MRICRLWSCRSSRLGGKVPYRKGAENAKAAGVDGVDVHGANGYLALVCATILRCSVRSRWHSLNMGEQAHGGLDHQMRVAARQPGIVHDGSRRAILSRAVMHWDAGNVTSRRFGTSAQHSEKGQRKYGAYHKWCGGCFSGIR
jgi:hypothetical protein